MSVTSALATKCTGTHLQMHWQLKCSGKLNALANKEPRHTQGTSVFRLPQALNDARKPTRSPWQGTVPVAKPVLGSSPTFLNNINVPLPCGDLDYEVESTPNGLLSPHGQGALKTSNHFSGRRTFLGRQAEESCGSLACLR